MSEKKLSAKIELNSEQAVKGAKALTDEIKKLSAAAQQAYPSMKSLFSETSLSSQPGLVKEIQGYPKIIEALKALSKPQYNLPSARAEAMRDLARRGNSQVEIDKAARFAMADVAANSSLNVKREAMSDLSRRGGSQDAINQAAKIAMADVAINKEKEKLSEALKKQWQQIEKQTAQLESKRLSRPGAIDPSAAHAQNVRSALLGVGMLPLNTFFSARLLSSAASGMGGQGGGGGGGLLGSNSGKYFNEFYIAIEAFKKAIGWASEQIRQSYAEGFRLFTKASQLRVKASELYATEQAAKATGVDPSQIDQFMLRNQWGRARNSLQNFGQGSQLTGLADEFYKVKESAREVGEIMERTAGKFFNVTVAGQATNREWEAVRALFAEQMTGATKLFLDDLSQLLKMLRESGAITDFARVVGFILIDIEKMAQLFMIFVGSIANGFEVVKALAETFVAGMANTFYRLFTFIKELFSQLINNPAGTLRHPINAVTSAANSANRDYFDIGSLWKEAIKGSGGLSAMLKSLFTKWPDTSVPERRQSDLTPRTAPPSFTHWERLGLTIGSGMVRDEQRQIVANTGKTADGVDQVAALMAQLLGARLGGVPFMNAL